MYFHHPAKIISFVKFLLFISLSFHIPSAPQVQKLSSPRRLPQSIQQSIWLGIYIFRPLHHILQDCGVGNGFIKWFFVGSALQSILYLRLSHCIVQDCSVGDNFIIWLVDESASKIGHLFLHCSDLLLASACLSFFINSVRSYFFGPIIAPRAYTIFAAPPESRIFADTAMQIPNCFSSYKQGAAENTRLLSHPGVSFFLLYRPSSLIVFSVWLALCGLTPKFCRVTQVPGKCRHSIAFAELPLSYKQITAEDVPCWMFVLVVFSPPPPRGFPFPLMFQLLSADWHIILSDIFNKSVPSGCSMVSLGKTKLIRILLSLHAVLDMIKWWFVVLAQYSFLEAWAFTAKTPSWIYHWLTSPSLIWC